MRFEPRLGWLQPFVEGSFGLRAYLTSSGLISADAANSDEPLTQSATFGCSMGAGINIAISREGSFKNAKGYVGHQHLLATVGVRLDHAASAPYVLPVLVQEAGQTHAVLRSYTATLDQLSLFVGIGISGGP